MINCVFSCIFSLFWTFLEVKNREEGSLGDLGLKLRASGQDVETKIAKMSPRWSKMANLSRERERGMVMDG